MSSVLSKQDLDRVISAAIAAPSVLNSQPWAFRASEDTIDVLADRSRAAIHLDPQGRELLMSCGAALFNLTLALRASGRAVDVSVLPDAQRPDLVARVRLLDEAVAGADDLRLHAAIPLRRTSRNPFDGRPVPEVVIKAFQAAAELEGARLDLPPNWHRSALAGLVHDADRAQRDRPEVVEDVRAWTGVSREDHSGIPVENLGPRPSERTALVRDFAMNTSVPDRPTVDFDTDALLMVLLTALDTPADRVLAGQGLERVLLEAASRGVSVSLLTQVTEVPELRQWLRDPGTAWGFPQALLRFGYGPMPPATPRRGVEEVMLVD